MKRRLHSVRGKLLPAAICRSAGVDRGAVGGFGFGLHRYGRGNPGPNIIRSIAAAAVVLAMILIIGGCAGGRYGNIFPDDQTTRDFDSFRIDPGMNYYYSGPDLFPNALIGLKKEYVLDNELWKPINPTPASFRGMILHMQEKARDYREFQHGFLMYDDAGKPIGVWYSILKARTFVKMGEGNKVVVYTPDLMIYQSGGGSAIAEAPEKK